MKNGKILEHAKVMLCMNPQIQKSINPPKIDDKEDTAEGNW